MSNLLQNELEKVTGDVTSVTLYKYKSNENRFYAIVDYKDHRSASLARRKLIPNNDLFGQSKGVIVEWARDKKTCQFSSRVQKYSGGSKTKHFNCECIQNPNVFESQISNGFPFKWSQPLETLINGGHLV